MRNLLPLLALLLLLGCSKAKEFAAISDNELNDLLALTKVAEYFYANPSIEKPIVKKIEGMIYGKIVKVRLLQPEIPKLNGTSLKGLCAAIGLSRNPDFGNALNDKQLTQLVTNYLASIELQLKQNTNELKKDNIF